MVSLTAKNLQDTEDANLHRWKNSAALATYLVKKASAEGLHDVGGAPGGPYEGAPTGPSKAMRNLHMGIGDIAILDEGYKPRQVQPAGEGAGYQTAVRILASLICNVIGVPYYEAMSDWDSVPERAMRPAAVSMKRRMLRDRNHLEHSVLNRMRKDFVSVCVSEGLWTPPADASLAEIFRVTWRWRVIQTVSLERKLKTMAELVLAGLYTPEDFVEDYMGADYKEHTRRWTENVARAKVQGSTVYDKVFAVDEEEGGVASDYVTVAEEEEAYERELVRSGRLDRSVLKRPAI